MQQDIGTFRPLSLRPHWTQYIISQTHWLILCIALFAIYFNIDMIIKVVFLWAGTALLFFLLYQALYLARVEYIVTGEQIIYLHGVLSHSTDYMELYRVIDYQQHRSLMQQMAGLKTVIIYSGDRNTPVMHLIGMREQMDVVYEIRQRVEYNKTMRHVYEITNRL